MIKLLIADDEPLVCVGLSSMIPWEDYNIEIVGTARNGRQAAEMIEKFRPDIVISDIKMPLKSGLELAEECFEKYGEIPLFIILTSFEEFEYVRRAIKFQAVDYLVKLELNAEILARTVNKALGILERIRGSGAAESVRRNAVNSLGEKFFLRLCNGLFESRDQYLAQKEELGIDFSAPAYSVLSCEIEPPDDSGKEADPSLYANAVQMIREITEKRIPVHVMTLGLRQFTMTLWLSETDRDAQKQSITNTLEAVMTGVRNYFSLNFRAAAGFPVDDPFCLSESYHSSRRIFRDCRPDRPLIVFESSVTGESGDFNFSEIRPVIRRAFEELDSAALHEAITAICDFFEGRTDLCLHALDAAGCILSMALTLLPEGEELVSEIFSDDAEGYRGLYRINSTGGVIRWLTKFRDGLGELLSSRRRNYKQQVVEGVKEYIRANLDKQLSLQDVAALFNFSPNYLSQLFTRYAGQGFVEFINQSKIAAAKELFGRRDARVYEIAEQLGFESAFYFSKVFKKIEGISPRDYIRKLESSGDNPIDGGK